MKKLSEVPNILWKSYLLRTNPVIHNMIINKYKSPFNYYRHCSSIGGRTIQKDYNNEQYSFEEFETNFRALRSTDGYDCIMIGIDPENNVFQICNINADTVMCGITIQTKQGSHLLNIALKFLNEHKNTINIKKIRLKDTAAISCPGSSRSIRLSDFLTLLTGDTWYGRYGFRPVDKRQREDYTYNRHIMNTTQIHDIDFRSILESNKTRLTEEQHK